MVPPLDNKGMSKKDAKHLLLLSRSEDGGDNRWYTPTLDDDQRLRVTADFTGSLEVNLGFDDEVTTLYGDPLDSGAQAASNPSFAFTYTTEGYIETITVPEYNGGAGGGAKRTFSYSTPGFISNITAWTAVP